MVESALDVMRRTKSLLFIRPDYHCCFFYRDELRKLGWKIDILVNPGYPANLLYSDKDVLRPPQLPWRKPRPIQWVNQLLFLLYYFAIFWRYHFHLYYSPPPLIDCKEAKIGLTWFFGRDFLLTTWIARVLGCRLIYQPSGCLEDDAKTDWLRLDEGNVCNNCGFYDRCDDAINLLNFRRIRRYFDFSIGFGYKDSKQLVEKHLKYKAIDLTLWSPDLDIPPEHQLPETKNLRILHSAYLKDSGRSWKGRNIKGSPYVIDAIERLKSEGYPVEYTYIEGKPSNQMRFYQAQADIVVEQLIYGWWGSTGVETMALGKPVVCYIRPSWKALFLRNFPEYEDLPIVEADTQSIYSVLKKLVTDANFREKKGADARRFAESHFDPTRNAKAFARLLELMLEHPPGIVEKTSSKD